MSCLCGLQSIWLGLPLKLPTIVYDVLNECVHVLHLNLRLKGLDKEDKTHFELDISFHTKLAALTSRGLQQCQSRFENWCGILLRTKAQMAAVMENLGIEISCVIKHTRTVGFFPVPEVANKHT